MILITGKGGKNRRRGKNENEAEKRELIFKEEGQEYAQVSLFFFFFLFVEALFLNILSPAEFGVVVF